MKDDFENEIIELNDVETEEEIIPQELEVEEMEEEQEEVPNKKEKKKKEKVSIKEKWRNLSKKQKIIIIVATVFVLLLIIGLIIYFVFFNKNEEIKEEKEDVIVEKDNYRYENGKLVFLDKSDREIGSYECKKKDIKSCFVAKLDFSTDKFDRILNVSEDGKEIEKTSQIYYDKYVFIEDNNKIFLYNIKDKESDLELKNIKSYNTEKNLVVVTDKEDNNGLLEITNDDYDYLIRPSYDYLGIINTKLSYVLALDKGEAYILDENGKKLSNKINNEVMSVDKNFVVSKNGSSYNLYNYKYEELLSGYEYISLHDSLISLVKDNKLYLIDNNLNKLYEEGIKLTNKDYNKKYIYENNKLKETKSAYEIEVKGNNAVVTIDKETKNINLYEGKVNSKYNYVSYFDGKLYIYSDTNKEDVAGTYTCKNKNNITSENSTLDNCIIYNSNGLYSGIYNNEFIFIKDGNNNEINYYLYDLKEKKNKGTYSELNFLKGEELSNEIKPIYTSSSYIIAKSATGNNKGNYGILEINSSNVKGKLEFKYKSITLKDNYYILVNVNDIYSLCDTSFNVISNDFSYIDVYNNYYIGVSNNVLNIYKYTSKDGIIKDGLKVNNNNFKVEQQADGSFKITIDTKTYEYDANGVEKKIEKPIEDDKEDEGNIDNEE